MLKRILSAASLVGILVVSGCASVPMASESRDASLKAFPAPSEERAAIYIYRNSLVGQALKKNVYLDGEFLGESANKVYFHREITPGEHEVSTESEFSDNAIKFIAEAGKNYFARQYIKLGLLVGGAGIEMVSEEEGKKNVLESGLAE